MSENPFAAFTPKKEWLVCVDSDGCAMDTMDSKHHQAFCPQLIRVYGLEEYAGLITPHWMEVNLYSRTRGVNRFKGLAATMRMLAEHGVRVPGADELCTWVEKAPKLSNPALEEAVAAGGGAGLQKALEWSRAVNAAIAAMGVVQRITTFGASAMIGFGQGFQPVCGFNYGARLYHRVKEGFWFCVKVAAVFLLVIGALGFAFAPQLIALFRDDPGVIAIGTVALRFQCVTFFFQAWITMSNMMLQTIGRTVPATFVAMARQGIFFIPLVWLLSLSPLGLLGVQMAQSVSDLLTLAAAVPIQLYVLRQMSQMQPAKV